jgi:hypothetical protein
MKLDWKSIPDDKFPIVPASGLRTSDRVLLSARTANNTDDPEPDTNNLMS